MTTIEKIRAEIERHTRHETTDASYLELGRIQGNNEFADYLLAFLDTLEAEEKEGDLDGPTIAEEIRRLGPNPSEYDVALHFYNLGLNNKK